MRQYDTIRPSVLSLAFGFLAIALARKALWLTYLYDDFVSETPDCLKAFAKAGLAALGERLVIALGVLGAIFLVCAVAAFVRRRWALRSLRAACWIGYGVALYGFNAIMRVTGVYFDTGIPMEGNAAEETKVVLFFLQWDLLKWWLLALALLAGTHVLLHMRKTINLYSRRDEVEPAVGDRMIENLRTHGSDPRYRKSWWISVTAHLMVIIIIPWLLTLGGCVEPYRVPKGSGDPVVALVKMVKPQPKKKKPKKYILRMDTAIIFHIPDLDESQVFKEVEEQSQITYKTDKWVANARSGKMGQGGGKTGGWPLGMDQGKVRFIRLEHRGVGWDDGMDPISRADVNFLEEFKKLTGFKIESRGESHPVRLLAKYPKGYAPPFVYMTGNGAFDIPDRDVKILRDYLMGGGMLFGDCGAPDFGKSFRQFASTLLPGERLVEIGDDDPLFREPYVFVNGAPPLWHHDGRRALGVKYKGRWAVFYHPGDVNDAWKTGHSKMRADLAEGAFQMGVNVVYYSFTRYLELTAKYRKK